MGGKKKSISSISLLYAYFLLLSIILRKLDLVSNSKDLVLGSMFLVSSSISLHWVAVIKNPGVTVEPSNMAGVSVTKNSLESTRRFRSIVSEVISGSTNKGDKSLKNKYEFTPPVSRDEFRGVVKGVRSAAPSDFGTVVTGGVRSKLTPRPLTPPATELVTPATELVTPPTELVTPATELVTPPTGPFPSGARSRDGTVGPF